MFLLDFFYGTKTKPTGQPEEDWVLVDNNEPTTLSTSLDDYGILEKDELPVNQLDPEPQPNQPAINPPSSQIESELEEVAPEQEIEVQNPTGGRIGPLKVPKVLPVANQSTSSGLAKAESAKVKNNCKKQAQRRADKYKSGVWSGRSNDRKCGKCY